MTILSQLTTSLAFLLSVMRTEISASEPEPIVLPAKWKVFSSGEDTCNTLATEWTRLHTVLGMLLADGRSRLPVFSFIPVNLPGDKTIIL